MCVRDGIHRRRERHGGSHVGVLTIERVRVLALVCRWSRQRLKVVLLRNRKRLSGRQKVPRGSRKGSHGGQESGMLMRSDQEKGQDLV